MKGKNVLILGGAGFLGQSILNHLHEHCEIKSFYGDINPINETHYSYLNIDILSKSDFKKLNIKFDIIVNCTGQISNPTNLFYRLNTDGVSNIIEFVSKISAKLIQISTINVYGSASYRINEESPINPETPYGSIKAFAEFQIMEKLSPDQYSIIRLSNLYGDRQPKGFISYLISAIQNKQEPFFNNDGTLKRYFLNVIDAAEFVYQNISIFKPGVYNLVGPDFYSIRDIIQLAMEITGKNISVDYSSVKPWENLSEVDPSKIRDTFNFEFKHQIKNYLKDNLAKHYGA